MSSYTITIAADDRSRATTILTVELEGTTARIVELLVRAGEGDGLTAGQIPAVDVDLLLKAITPAVGGQQAITVSPAAAADAPVDPARLAVDDEGPVTDTNATQSVGATTSTVEEPATTIPANDVAEVAVPKQPTRTNASTAGATRAGGRKAVTGVKATVSGRKAKKQAPKREASKEKGRVYRRSPDDLESVYQQAGSVAAVADHYDVPRHTAQGWIRTLRRRQASTAE
ncbi:hypothetical protein ONA91_37535 [Micromonospora sp. DR5-3]|uniref:hypothetical protein n=1 Tax=unclassified Micromonospora TaxID=2617518 RepID=UPI0016524C81|nr:MULTISPECIES: hypothetical protein [unclassified Micromonospora]MCW3820148.1 hypothetical protein [Micromonospora sp. DR5-3]